MLDAITILSEKQLVIADGETLQDRKSNHGCALEKSTHVATVDRKKVEFDAKVCNVFRNLHTLRSDKSSRSSGNPELRSTRRDRPIEERLGNWVNAYGHAGRGSTVVRAHEIREIYEEAASVPLVIITKHSGEFLDKILNLIDRATADGGGHVWTSRTI